MTAFSPFSANSDAFAVPLIDMLEFLFEAKDRGMITLDDDKEQMIESMRGTLVMRLCSCAASIIHESYSMPPCRLKERKVLL